MIKIGRRNGFSLPDLFLEVVSIVFGILFALWLNGWQTDRQHEHSVQKSLRNIRTEIRNNRKNLSRVFPYHQTCLRTISDSHGEAVVENFFSIWRGLRPPILHRSAYETAHEVQALAYMDYETASAISLLYSRQEFIFQLMRMYAQVFISDLNRSDARRLAITLQPAFSDIVQAEQELATQYQKVLILLDQLQQKNGIISFSH